MIDTILFDLDGTLINTNELIIDSFKYVFKKHFKDIKLTEKDYIDFIGPTLYDSFKKYSSDEEFVLKMIDEYRSFNIREHDTYVKPYNNLEYTLSHLKNYKLGIVSSKKYDTVIKGLELFNIKKYFKIIVTQETVLKHKPDPEGLIYACKALNSKDAIYVGDNPSDILAGKNANMKTIGVSYSYKFEQLKNSNPDYIIDDLSEIIKIVGGL